MPFNDAFVLDVGAARTLKRVLKQRRVALQRLIEQLGTLDKVEVEDRKTGKLIKRHDRRLISPVMAEALAVAWPDAVLFIPFNTYRNRRKVIVKRLTSGNKKLDKNGDGDGDGNGDARGHAEGARGHAEGARGHPGS